MNKMKVNFVQKTVYEINIEDLNSSLMKKNQKNLQNKAYSELMLNRNS